MPRTQRYITLDGLRGLAALAIVLCHLPLLTGVSPATVFQASQPFVLFFFVLSGFTLTHAYGRRLHSGAALGRFFIGRTLRVFPLHLFLLAIVLPLRFATPVDGAGDAVSLESLLPSLLLLQAWLPGADSLAFNPAAWSLSVGYFLWLFLGLALLALPRGRGAVLACLVALTLWALLNGSAAPGNPILLAAGAFFLGALLPALHQALRLLPLGLGAFTILELTALALLALVLGGDYAYRALYAIPLFALALFIFAFEGGLLSRLLRLGPFRLLGRWSFPMSLAHLVVFMLAAPLVALPQLDGVLPRYAPQALALCGVLLLAALSHRLVERPGIALGRRLRSAQPGVAVSQARG